MREDRLKRKAAEAPAQGLMQATTYESLEAPPDSPAPLDIIEETDSEDNEESLSEAEPQENAPTSLSMPLLADADAELSAPATVPATLPLRELCTPMKSAQGASQAALNSAPALTEATLTHQELITPMKGATAADLADGSASEDPEDLAHGRQQPTGC